MQKPIIVNNSQIYKIQYLFETGDFILLSRMQYCKWCITKDFSLGQNQYCIVHKKDNKSLEELLK